MTRNPTRPGWTALLPAWLLLCAAPAFADVVTLEDGRRLEGLVEETKGGDLRVTTELGSVVVPRKDVLKVERQTPPWKALENRLEALRDGDLNTALDVAIYAIAHDMRRRAAAILERGLTPGDVRGALRALEFCERNRIQREVRELARGALGGEAPLRGSAHDAATLGRRCLALGLRAEARRLFRFAIEQAPLLAAAEAGLQILEFHKVGGRWVPPEVYYPARGYQLQQGRWRLPEEIATLRAEGALSDANRAVTTAQSALNTVQRAEASARAQRARALGDRAHGAADLESARLRVASRGQDLRRAEARERDARRALTRWCALEPRIDAGGEQSADERSKRRGARTTPASSPLDHRRWRERHATLERSLASAEQALAAAKVARDRQVQHVERLGHRIANAEAALAAADGALAGSAGRIAAAEASLQAALAAAREARTARDAALERRDQSRAAAAKARARER